MEADTLQGFKLGADDYLTKPFEPKELLLRINNLITSHNLYKKEQKIARIGNYLYDLSTKNLTSNDQIIA